MHASPRFWAAFWAGLAVPVDLYSGPAPYAAYIGGYSLPQTFAAIGLYMSHAVGQFQDDRTPSASTAAA
jgi:hypothetical protein